MDTGKQIMETFIYILIEHFPYEGSLIYGAFTDEYEAREFAKTLDKTDYPEMEVWNGSEKVFSVELKK